MNEITSYVSLGDWLLSLSMFSLFIQVVAFISPLFLDSQKIFYCIQIPYFVYPFSVARHLGCFSLLALRANAAKSIRVQDSVWICFHFS